MKQMFLLLLYLLMLPFQVASQTCEWSERVSYCCLQIERFTIDDITGIKEIYDLTIDDLRFDSDKWFDLQGRPLTAKPTRSGLYIQGNKKIFTI